jgi:hypothetical protein
MRERVQSGWSKYATAFRRIYSSDTLTPTESFTLGGWFGGGSRGPLLPRIRIPDHEQNRAACDGGKPNGVGLFDWISAVTRFDDSILR